MPPTETGLGVQSILLPAVSPDFPLSFVETPGGLLLGANGIDPVFKWSGLASKASLAGVAAPATAPALAGVGVGSIVGKYVAYVRYVDADRNPSPLSPVSNEIDCGTDGLIDAVAFSDTTGKVTITSLGHGRATGQQLVIAGVEGLALVNGTWTITVVDADSFTLNGLTVTAGLYEQGGSWTYGVASLVYSSLPRPTDEKVTTRQVLRNLSGDASVFYVDVETTDLTSDGATSSKSDAELMQGEAVPYLYDDELPYAQRYTPPPSHKPFLAVQQGYIFAGGDALIDAGHAEPAFGSAVVRGVGTDWRRTFIGRRIYLGSATKSYEIADVDEAAQTITLTAIYDDDPTAFCRYLIRSAPGERKLVYYSEPQLAEAWPPWNALAIPEDSDDVTGLMSMRSFLFVLENRNIYKLTFEGDPVRGGHLFQSSNRGCVNDRCWAQVEGDAYMLDESGIHRFDGQDSEPISQPVQDVFQQDGLSPVQIDWTGDRRLWHAAPDPVRDTIRWFVSMVGDSGPEHALCYNYRTRRWWVEQYPEPITASCIGTLGYRRSLAGTSARRVVVLAEGVYDVVLPGGGTLRGTPTGATSTTLSDLGASFDAIEGAPITIVEGTGRGQSRIVATVSGGGKTIEVVEAWETTPDATSLYQIGGIPWSWRSGWYRYADDETSNARDVEVVFEPTSTGAGIDLQLYFDHAVTPEVWAFADDKDGVRSTAGSPYIAIDTATGSGYAMQRSEGHRDSYAHGQRFVSAALSGVAGGDPIRVYQIILNGATP